MDRTAHLRAAELALEAAIRTSDLVGLDELLDDRLVHVGSDGSPQDKRQLMESHASGSMRIHRLEQEALDVVVDGSTGITRVTMVFAGHAHETFYVSRAVLTRTWIQRGGRWRVLAEHVTFVEPIESNAPPPRAQRVVLRAV